MDPLGHPDPVLDQKPWVYEGGLVSDKLRTFFSLFRKLLLKKFFELIVAVEVYSIPELIAALVEIVD